MASKTLTCKYCDMLFKDIDRYVAHMEQKHSDMIPEDMTPWQYVYYLKTGKKNGSCIMCKKPTEWDEKVHKYKRLCGSDKCHDDYVKMFRSRMIGKYGKMNLLNDPQQQRVMLSRRKISNVYTWSDHVSTTVYTGTYERDFLEFLDHVLQFDPSDVIAPSPHTYYYVYDNKQHFYFPDFFIPSLNLEVEIKENTNKHPKILAVDKVKEKLKDEVMRTNQNAFNYIKIVEKDNEKFLNFLEEAKRQTFEGIKKPIFMP